jgi:DNA-directed RNA polymerase III subunit RPC11
MLRVSKVPPGDPTTEDYVGQNRFECLTCPYHFVINKRYFERKYMKKKEVEDILGGKGAWDNVDKTQGTLAEEIAEDGIKCCLCGFWHCMETNKRIVQCPNEKCRNDAAYWYQLQIRSADEPMTAFYKVGLVLGSTELSLTDDSVPNVRRNGENELVFSASHTWSSGAFECTAIYPIFFLVFIFHGFLFDSATENL